MAIFIDFSNSNSTNCLGKQTNNSDQDAIIRWPIVSRSAWPIVPRVANGRFISVFAVILVKHCRDKQWQ